MTTGVPTDGFDGWTIVKSAAVQPALLVELT